MNKPKVPISYYDDDDDDDESPRRYSLPINLDTVKRDLGKPQVDKKPAVKPKQIKPPTEEKFYDARSKFVCGEVKRGVNKNQARKTPKFFLPTRPIPPPPPPIDEPCPPGTKCKHEKLINIEWSDSDNDESCMSCPCTSTPCKPYNPYKYFKPQLYDFEFEDYDAVKDLVIDNERKFDDNITIRCPEYPILLDHVIAVVWHFYRDWMNWNMFTVPQLEWAVKFLAGIFSYTGDRFTDMETIGGHLEELLFINYSEVDSCLVAQCGMECAMAEKFKPEKPKNDLPVTLQSLFYRAPEFTKYLARKKSKCKPCIISKGDNLKYDQMAEQLQKLREYEMRYMQALSKHVELQEIIDGINIHTEKLLKTREELKTIADGQ